MHLLTEAYCKLIVILVRLTFPNRELVKFFIDKGGNRMLLNIINHPYSLIISQFLLFYGVLLFFALTIVILLKKFKTPEWLYKPAIIFTLMASMFLVIQILK